MKYLSQYTKEQRNSCGVYKIINTVNNKCYIGSSINMRKRKSQHQLRLRSNKHGNVYLQNAWNKYGEDKFVFEILWYCNKEEQQDSEQKFLDLIKPEYNLLKKAFVRPKKAQEQCNKKLRKRYYLINPDGIQMCTDNLRGFCEDHNIKRDNIAHLLVQGNSARRYYKGWYITADPTELKEDNRYTKEKWLKDNVDTYRLAREEYITYIWDTKTDTSYIVGDITNATHLTLHCFCDEFNLTKESIRSAFNKGRNNYKHFVIYREYKTLEQPSAIFLSQYYLKHKDFKIKKQRTCPYIYTAISPKGKTYTVTKDTKGFCKEHNLDSSSFLKVARGKLKSVKGWKVTRQLKE